MFVSQIFSNVSVFQCDGTFKIHALCCLYLTFIDYDYTAKLQYLVYNTTRHVHLQATMIVLYPIT